MRIEIDGAQIRFNGNAISKRLFKSVLDEFFAKETQAEIFAAIERDGYAECEIIAWHGEPLPALKRANKKIALLEKQVAKLTIQNLYEQLK